MMTLAKQRRDLMDGERDIFARTGRDPDVVEIEKASELRRVGHLDGRLLGIKLDLFVRKQATDGVDRAWSRRSRRLRTLPHASDPKFDRRQRRDQKIILVPSHHVGAFTAENSDDAQS